ncbi:hypothetical protein G6O48_28195, partial [Salmonella enterica subsp. enterica serovar Enteritidis]|nr:hypothetical protein [Salmonella enterica subsp. enterica serovar Enteritidis]
QLADAVLRDPDVDSLSGNVGVDGVNPSLNQGRMLINLKPQSERGSQAALLDRLAERVHGIPGVQGYFRPVQDLTIDS